MSFGLGCGHVSLELGATEQRNGPRRGEEKRKSNVE